uniref:FAD-dependent monooxygenase n=1 Tax=Cupriavidus ulmosensis TaxID=3065913 RepID=UPI003F873D01
MDPASEWRLPARLRLRAEPGQSLVLRARRGLAPRPSASCSLFVVPPEDNQESLLNKRLAGREVKVPLVVGADGARSTVRKRGGFGFEGFTWREKFLVTNVAMPMGNAGLHRHDLFLRPRTLGRGTQAVRRCPPRPGAACYQPAPGASRGTGHNHFMGDPT